MVAADDVPGRGYLTMNSSRLEHEVILIIARRELNAFHRARLHLVLKQSLDFDYLFETAHAHGLLPLLYKNLSESAAMLSSEFMSRLRSEAIANSQNVLHLIGEQLRAYKFLYQQDIRVAVFKGSVLAKMAYGEISLRQAGDIDMLVHRKHFERAKWCLQSLGYQMSPKLADYQLASHLNNHCEIQFVRQDGSTIVDLHWNLAPRSFVFRVKPDEMMLRLQRVCLPGTIVETFGTEDSVLYQSMHGAKHLWRRLEWIIALAETLRTSPVDWEILLDYATRAHAKRILGLGLRLVEKFSDVDIPVNALASLDPDGDMYRMAQDVGDQIFTTYGAADSTETNLYNLRIMDRKRDALISTLRAIFVPTVPDWQTLTVPASLRPLYYAYRPLRLSKVYGTSLLRRVTRNA